ncbi:MAG: hypothetical protein ACYDC1_11985 [Limisphaerales bacterium]
MQVQPFPGDPWLETLPVTDGTDERGFIRREGAMDFDRGIQALKIHDRRTVGGLVFQPFSVQPFPTLAAMVAYPGLVSGRVYFVMDGGQFKGYQMVDPDSSTPNEGTVLVPAHYASARLKQVF